MHDIRVFEVERYTVERISRGTMHFFLTDLLKRTKGGRGKRKEYLDGREMWTVELKSFEGNP